MSDPVEPPSWDEETAEALRSAYVLVGITTLDANGGLVSQHQIHGRVSVADPDRGVCIELEGHSAGESYWLPPDLRSFEPANPGEYRLRSTGEVVVDPDFVSSWTITKPAET
jgi:hypothetical protein